MKYIALTIGPIYKTLKNSKKTRELWGGSYIFSYIMKKIIEKFKDREFVTPYVDENVFKSGKEVGLFHDRFIFRANENDTKQSVQKIIDEVLDSIELLREKGIEVDLMLFHIFLVLG
jgi:CRISPR-associated protein Cmr2